MRAGSGRLLKPGSCFQICIAEAFNPGVFIFGESDGQTWNLIFLHLTFNKLFEKLKLGGHTRPGSLLETFAMLQGFRRWVLSTKDAHVLYEQFGFIKLHRPERWMERPDPNMKESPDYWQP